MAASWLPSRTGRTGSGKRNSRDGVTLKQLAAFTHHLQSNDPTLHLAALHLTNRRPETDVYNTDLAVSYLVYAPQS